MVVPFPFFSSKITPPLVEFFLRIHWDYALFLCAGNRFKRTRINIYRQIILKHSTLNFFLQPTI